MSLRIAFFVVVLFGVAPHVFADQPTWAKKAVAFPEQCWSGKDEEFYTYKDCTPLRIQSPDGKGEINVFYRSITDEGGGHILQAFLRVTTPTQGTREAALPDGFQKVDLLWSPDGRAFFVNGGNGGGYWGMWVYVYLLDGPQLKPLDLTREAQRDMVKSFPPCKAAYPNSRECNIDPKKCDEPKIEQNEEDSYNLTGIDWVNPSTMLILAEVPCSTSEGGIMCQVMGYEVEVPRGRIIKRIDAKGLKRDWQKSMAWNLRIPEPPRYCNPSSARTGRPSFTGYPAAVYTNRFVACGGRTCEKKAQFSIERAPRGRCVLVVTNGNGEGGETVSSYAVYLNGKLVIANSHNDRREAKVTVSKQNHIRVVLTGAADASIFLVLAYVPAK